MSWCELHNSSGVKGGITNFDPAEYEKDLSWLQVVNQVTRPMLLDFDTNNTSGPAVALLPPCDCCSWTHSSTILVTAPCIWRRMSWSQLYEVMGASKLHNVCSGRRKMANWYLTIPVGLKQPADNLPSQASTVTLLHTLSHLALCGFHPSLANIMVVYSGNAHLQSTA